MDIVEMMNFFITAYDKAVAERVKNDEQQLENLSNENRLRELQYEGANLDRHIASLLETLSRPSNIRELIERTKDLQEIIRKGK